MEWNYRLADRIAPEIFYIAKSGNHNGPNTKGTAPSEPQSNPQVSLRSIRWPERAAYALRTGRLPVNPKLSLVSSGGSCKGYYLAGVMQKLDEVGIRPDNYVLNSATSLLSLYAFGIRFHDFRDFVMQVPEMIDVQKNLSLQSRVRYKLMSYSREKDAKSIQFTYEASRNNEIIFIMDRLADNLRQIFRKSDGRDTTIGELENVTLMATDVSTRKSVALGPQFPQMPAYHAIITSMSAPPLFRPVEYVHGDETFLLADGGVTYQFPLLDSLVPQDNTVLAVDLNYRNMFSDLEQKILGSDALNHIKEMALTSVLVTNFSGSSPEQLLQDGDTRNQRMIFLAPETRLPPYSIRIPKDQRKEIMDHGYRDMEAALRNVRLV